MTTNHERSSRPEALCRELASGQHGVVSRDQAIAAGLSVATIRRRVVMEQWKELMPRAYTFPGVPSSWEQSVTAACMSVGECAVVSHRSAGYLWGFPNLGPDVVELSTTANRQLIPER